MSSEPEEKPAEAIDKVTGIATTGHSWDGISELNNPLPRWWLIVFYATIFWALIYCIFMPAFPGLPGVRNHSERANVEAAMMAANEARATLSARLLASTDLAAIERDPDLLEFALVAGQSAFGDNCATCHGTGERANPGYPNLADDVWLWGGTLTEINYTITHGIRSGTEQARHSLMPYFGDGGILSAEAVNDLTDLVLQFAGREANADAALRARPIYAAQCAICHGARGEGDQAQGAPRLTDSEWLYGSDRGTIRTQIWNAHNGVMPSWGQRLDAATIAALSVYVHTLGGGEAIE